MANKTHGTRQKMTFRVPAAKPRNPLAVPAAKRSAGPHGPTPKAVRARQRSILKKLLERPEE